MSVDAGGCVHQGSLWLPLLMERLGGPGSAGVCGRVQSRRSRGRHKAQLCEAVTSSIGGESIV